MSNDPSGLEDAYFELYGLDGYPPQEPDDACRRMLSLMRQASDAGCFYRWLLPLPENKHRGARQMVRQDDKQKGLDEAEQFLKEIMASMQQGNKT